MFPSLFCASLSVKLGIRPLMATMANFAYILLAIEKAKIDWNGKKQNITNCLTFLVVDVCCKEIPEG